jgi:hypothetical protein
MIDSLLHQTQTIVAQAAAVENVARVGVLEGVREIEVMAWALKWGPSGTLNFERQ